jgi:acyl carrier protein
MDEFKQAACLFWQSLKSIEFLRIKVIMTVLNDVTGIVSGVLQLAEGNRLGGDSALMGAMPEFDSMAVVSILTALEEYYGFVVDDDEINSDVFETIGSLVVFVERKLQVI